MTLKKRTLASTLAAALALPLGANALIIDVTTSDLGSGIWQYSYLLELEAGEAFSQNDGLSIFFDYNQFGTLSNPTAPSGWDAITLQPDAGNGLDGLFDVLALVNNPQLPGPFTVDVQWLGSGTPPMALPFDAYVCNDPPTCASISPHPTIPPGTTGVPTPAPLALLTIGLVGLAARRALRN